MLACMSLRTLGTLLIHLTIYAAVIQQVHRATLQRLGNMMAGECALENCTAGRGAPPKQNRIMTKQ